jgi:hypothetical protein
MAPVGLRNIRALTTLFVATRRDAVALVEPASEIDEAACQRAKRTLRIVLP